MSVNEKMTTIADEIRDKTGGVEKLSLDNIAVEIPKVYEAGYNKGKSEGGGGISLSDNLVIPPGESLIGNNYTINADGTVTVSACSDWYNVMMYWSDIWKDGNYSTFSFLPMKNGKTYKLTVTPSEDVGDNTLAVNYACFNDDINEEFNVCEINFENGGSATFTIPEEPYYLQFITLPCFTDKSVTYTFDLREVMTKESIYEAGKKAEYDAFWDSFQNYGDRKAYEHAFRESGWNDKTFKPKYDITPSNFSYGMNNSSITNLKQILEDCGVVLDTKNVTNLLYAFGNGAFTHIGVVDGSNAVNFNYCFYKDDKLETIDKIILKEDGTQTFDNAFAGCSSLKEIRFEGVIGKNISIAHKGLSKESIISVINALSSTTSGLTLSLSKTAVDNAFGIDVDDVSTYPEGSEYYILRQSKSNWTISYA